MELLHSLADDADILPEELALAQAALALGGGAREHLHRGSGDTFPEPVAG